MNWMTLQEAVAFIEDGMIVDDALPKEGAIEICSGGTRRNDAADPPGLYDSIDRAIDAWRREMSDLIYAHDYDCIRWVTKPGVDHMIMTMMDSRGTQRVVTNRYFVTAKVAFANGRSSEEETQV